jgi:hypothetical protein
VSGIGGDITDDIMALPSGSNKMRCKKIDGDHIGDNTDRRAVDSIARPRATAASISGGKIERLGSIFVTGFSLAKQATNHSITGLLSDVKADNIAHICAGTVSERGRRRPATF